MLVCDKCGASIIPGSQFCGQCADPVTDADRATTVVTAGAPALAQITFGASSSPAYARAVALCEKLPSYAVIGEGRQVEHRITLPVTEVELLSNIFDLVGSWKSSQMLIAGQPATKRDLTYNGLGCFRSRQKAFKPEAYCFGERQHEANIWGCKRLSLPIAEWGGGWLDYGNFDKSGAWRFDKARIRHELEIALTENQLCPVLDRARVLQTLEQLPDAINPKTDPTWKYRTTYESVNGSYKEVAVGILPVIKRVNRLVIGDFRPAWEEGVPETATSTPVARPAATRVAVEAGAGSKGSGGVLGWLLVGVVVLGLVGMCQ